MAADILATADPEAAAFFADARAALAPTAAPFTIKPKPVTLPADWPITPHHAGATLTRAELHAAHAHALRISYDYPDGRHTLWVDRWRGGEWSILQGYAGQPAGLLTSPRTWHASVRALTEYAAPGRWFGGGNFTVDEWVPEFTTLCLAHRDDCGERDGGHNFVQRRTLPRYPEGTCRPCGGPGSHRGDFQYRFHVDGRWRLRFGCRRHHRELLDRYLGEADGTVAVRLMDDHLDSGRPS
jgi:hypothetical protein